MRTYPVLAPCGRCVGRARSNLEQEDRGAVGRPTRGDRMQEASAPPRGQPGTPQASLLAGLEASGVPVIERRYAPGQHPYMRGDPDEGLWFLLEGTLEVYKLYNTFSKATVRLLDGEGLFGEPSLRSEGPHRDSAESVSACRAAKVPKGPLLRLLSEDATHASTLLCSFAGCAEEREAATERLLDREVERRLARLLLELAGRFGEGVERGTRGKARPRPFPRPWAGSGKRALSRRRGHAWWWC